ncbi:hypothetical protein AVEN_68541-1 [Araneus ventricosus]|uniref:CCHC-type domain-containing protein n=1 Tax=Araneus ventricosus TaxID=182803 RepID=A0A4Y2HCQ8_ARAVE|nr:hypothetical protein AVEN_68541-1 [Araneus ventricosus]
MSQVQRALPPPTSFSEAVTWVPANKRKAKNVSLVFARNKDTFSEEVKETIQKVLAPSKLNVGIRNIKKLAKGEVAIECDSAKDTEKILKEINSNTGLNNVLDAKKPTKKLHRIVMYDIEYTIPKEEVLETITSQNEELKSQDIKILFKLRSKQAGKCHWIVETQQKTFHALLRKKIIFFECQRLSLREFLRPTRCYKGNKFEHISPNCPNAESCPQCGEEGHKTADCAQAAKCINCSEANGKFNLDYDTNHTASGPCCSSLKHEIEKLISRTNYGR